MEERELELPELQFWVAGPPRAGLVLTETKPSEWGAIHPLYTADQVRQAVLAERNRSADKCAEQAKRWRDDRAVYVAFECAAAIRKG